MWQRHKVERGVWSEKMLVALEKGVKGAEQQRDRQPTGCPAGVSESESNVWFSLIDKVYADWTLALAWEPSRAGQTADRLPAGRAGASQKVKSNAGACGVDGITTGHFDKDSRNRLLAVKEHIKEGTYQPKPVKRVMNPKPGSAELRPLGIARICLEEKWRAVSRSPLPR